MSTISTNTPSLVSFARIATEAIARGLKVTPLVPKEKRPILPNWPNQASDDPTQIERWAALYPTANCGAVTVDSWILDIDDFFWFFAIWPFPKLPQTFAVRTGSGGLQFHFKKGEATKGLRNRSLKNPAFVEGGSDKSIKANFLDVLVDDRQGVLPDSVHPNGNLYTVLQELPLAEMDKDQLAWLLKLWDGKNTSTYKTKINPLRDGAKLADTLKAAGLKYTTHQEGTKTYYNYHGIECRGCLVKGAVHEANRTNDRCSAFVHDEVTDELYHFCFDSDCQETPDKTRTALAALGLKLEDLVVESWTKFFDTREDFERQPELEWSVEGISYTGEITGIGGLGKHGKTWLMLSIVKALLSGNDWLGRKVKQSKRVVYFIPEANRTVVYGRLKKMRLAEFIGKTLFIRTLSMGPAPDLTDKEIVKACEDADVFYDTLIRFVEGNDSDSKDIKVLAEAMFAIGAVARSQWFAHHAIKSSEANASISMAESFRGSGDIVNFATNLYGIMQQDKDLNIIHFEAINCRDVHPMALPFEIQGYPFIDDTGDFMLLGEVERKSKSSGQSRSGPKSKFLDNEMPPIFERMQQLRKLGKTTKEIAALLTETSDGRSISQDQVKKWFQRLSTQQTNDINAGLDEPTPLMRQQDRAAGAVTSYGTDEAQF
jgi:hypothetical protein